MSTPKSSEKMNLNANSPVIICMTHEDGNSLPAILQRLSQSWRHHRSLRTNEKHAHEQTHSQSEKKEPISSAIPAEDYLDINLARKIEAHQQKARSHFQQSEQLKHLSRQILEENKKMMNRHVRFKNLPEN